MAISPMFTVDFDVVADFFYYLISKSEYRDQIAP